MKFTLNDYVADRIDLKSVVHPEGSVDALVDEFHGPDRNWLADAHAVDGPAGARLRCNLSSGEVSRLIQAGKLRNISQLVFDVPGLSAELRAMVAPGPGEDPALLAELHSLCGLIDDLDYDEDPSADAGDDTGLPRSIDFLTLDDVVQDLARDLAALHAVHPELVSFGMEGALASAAAIVRPKYRIGKHKPVTSKQVHALLEMLARFHLVEALIRHARDAHTRFFQTTGFAFLDENGSAARTTKGSVLDKIEKQMDQLLRALEFYRQRRVVDPKERRFRILNQPALIAEAASFEAALISLIGTDATEAVVRQTLKRLGKRIRRFKGALLRLKSDKAFRQESAWKDRGPHPLEMLRLNAAFAAVWLRHEGNYRKRHVAGEDDDNSLENLLAALAARGYSRMHAALVAASAGQPPVPPMMGQRNDVRVAQRLFFTLRHLIVRDPDSEIVRSLKGYRDLDSLLRAFNADYRHRLLDNSRRESLSDDFDERARDWYRQSVSRHDRLSRSLVDEAQGYISFRLRT